MNAEPLTHKKQKGSKFVSSIVNLSDSDESEMSVEPPFQPPKQKRKPTTPAAPALKKEPKSNQTLVNGSAPPRTLQESQSAYVEKFRKEVSSSSEASGPSPELVVDHLANASPRPNYNSSSNQDDTSNRAKSGTMSTIESADVDSESKLEPINMLAVEAIDRARRNFDCVMDVTLTKIRAFERTKTSSIRMPRDAREDEGVAVESPDDVIRKPAGEALSCFLEEAHLIYDLEARAEKRSIQ